MGHQVLFCTVLSLVVDKFIVLRKDSLKLGLEVTVDHCH